MCQYKRPVTRHGSLKRTKKDELELSEAVASAATAGRSSGCHAGSSRLFLTECCCGSGEGGRRGWIRAQRGPDGTDASIEQGAGMETSAVFGDI